MAISAETKVPPSRLLPTFMLRLPVDVKAWIAEQAARNASSQNSEIVRCIRDAMDREKQKDTTR